MPVVDAIVALGSNLGDRLANLRTARDLVARLPGTLSLQASPVYETEPVGVSDAHRDLTYLNAVLAVRTTLDVETWSRLLHSIEDALHRVRTGEANAPRPIDVDLITFGDLRLSRPDLTLPHPRAALRRFVLQPLADLRPDLVLPGESRTVAGLLAALPAAPWVRPFGRLAPRPPHRPLPFLPCRDDLPRLLESGASIVRIPAGTYRVSETLRVRPHTRIVAAPGARIVADGAVPLLANADGAPTALGISVSGGLWLGDIAFHGVRGLRLAHLAVKGTVHLSRVDGFSLRHLRIDAPDAPYALVLGGCTRHGAITGLRGSIALLADPEPGAPATPTPHPQEFPGGPIDHIVFRDCPPPHLYRQKSTIAFLSFHRSAQPSPSLNLNTAATKAGAARRRAAEPFEQSSAFKPVAGLLSSPVKTPSFRFHLHITSPFGTRVHPVTGVPGTFHAGIDCVLRSGNRLLETGICAYADGTVLAAADTDGPAGTHVAIDHGRGLVTRYFHLEFGSLRVAPGDHVRRGTLLGWMGKTGRSTGEHLHFQMERDGVPFQRRPFRP